MKKDKGRWLFSHSCLYLVNISMEKLLELLNDYDPYIASDGEHQDNLWFYVYQGKSAVYDKKIGETIIISKNYWFIEWLYNHKKMTLERLKISDLYWDINDWVWAVDNIIMHLSISENPIELLISMLK